MTAARDLRALAVVAACYAVIRARRIPGALLDWAADRLDRLSPPSGQHAPMTPAATPAAGGAPAPTGAREAPAPAIPPGGAGASPQLPGAAPGEAVPPLVRAGAVPRPHFTPRPGFLTIPAATATAPFRAVPDDIPEDWPPGPLVRLYADPRWLLLDTRRIRARELAARVSTADGYGSAIWRARTRTGAAA